MLHAHTKTVRHSSGHDANDLVKASLWLGQYAIKNHLCYMLVTRCKNMIPDVLVEVASHDML
jgi:hypothetical protein